MSLPTTSGASVDRRRGSGPDGAALRREGEILAHARHPGVVELVALRADDDLTELDTSLPDGAPLALVALTVEEVAGVVAAVATTVADLHDIGVAHGRIGLDAVVIDADGGAVLHDFTDAAWLDGPPSRWPAHQRAREDDRLLGHLLAALLDRSAPSRLVSALERTSRWRLRAMRRAGRRAKDARTPAAVIGRWAAAASEGGVTSRRLAEALATEVKGARLPCRAPAPPPEDLLARGRDRPLREEVFDRWFAAPSEEVEVEAAVAMAASPDARPAPARRTANGARLTSVVVMATILLLALRALLGTGRAAAAPGGEAACGAPQAPCADYRSGVLTVGPDRYSVGSPGDVVALGRWQCAAPTLALLRPGTGDLWIYGSWPSDAAPIAPVLTRSIPGARGLRRRSGPRCDTLVVTRSDGAPVTIAAGAAS